MKILTTLTLWLCLLVAGSPTAMAQSALIKYRPTKPATTLENGKKYLIYNSYYSTTQFGPNRTGFLYDTGSSLGHTGPTHPLPNAFLADDEAYLWTVETTSDPNVFYIQSSAGKYVDIGGYTGNAELTEYCALYVQDWATSQCQDDGEYDNDYSTGFDGTHTILNTLTEGSGVWTISNTLEGGICWNGDATRWTTWHNPHPYCFYEYEEVDLEAHFPKPGKVYYIYCDNATRQYFYNDGGTLSVSHGIGEDDALYRFECAVENGKYIFRNLSNDKYFGFKAFSDSPYAYTLSDGYPSTVATHLYADANSRYLVMNENGSFDQAAVPEYTKDDSNPYSANFIFEDVEVRTLRFDCNTPAGASITWNGITKSLPCIFTVDPTTEITDTRVVLTYGEPAEGELPMKLTAVCDLAGSETALPVSYDGTANGYYRLTFVPDIFSSTYGLKWLHVINVLRPDNGFTLSAYGDGSITTEVIEADSLSHLWCFVGDYKSFKIYNYTDENSVITHEGTPSSGGSVSLAPVNSVGSNQSWTLADYTDATAYPGYCIEAVGTPGLGLNPYGGVPYPLKFYSSSDAGSHWTFAVVRQTPDSAFEVTPDDPEGWNDLSRPHKLTVQGTYESTAGLDGMIEYAVEDSDDWQPLTDMMPAGTAFTDSLTATFDAARAIHVIRLRSKDAAGNTTQLPSIEYPDVYYHEYSGATPQTYTGDSLFVDVACTDQPDLKFSVGRYQNNVNAGTATFSVEGVFPYTIGRKNINFRINPAPLTGAIEIDPAVGDTLTFLGEYQRLTPAWSFTNAAYAALRPGVDYEAVYTDNCYPGTATLTVTGKGNYTASLTTTFTIDKASLTDERVTVVVPPADVNYDGNPHPAQVYLSRGAGQATVSYVKEGSETAQTDAPTDEGQYDVYVEVGEGDWYYGRGRQHVGTFTIYKLDDAEWQALAGLYSQLVQMGASLNWNMAEGVKNAATFEGLTMKKGHVTGIAISGKDMTGTLPTAAALFPYLEELDLSHNSLAGDVPYTIAAIKTQNAAAFSALKRLNLSHNQYQGNVGLIGNFLRGLTALNVSYNKFEDLYPALPATLTDVDLSHQTMDKVVALNITDLKIDEVAANMPTLLLYDKDSHSYTQSINIICTKADLANFDKYTTDEWAIQIHVADNRLTIPYVSRQNAYRGESGDTLNVLHMIDDYTTHGSTFRIALSFNRGDANFVNGIDATDLQATILYAFGGYNDYPFNFTAADTYRDERINVQDVICTVDILLGDSEEQGTETLSAPRSLADAAAADAEEADACLYLRGGKLYLHSRVPVASLTVKATGNVKWDLRHTGLQQAVAGGNVVAYSLDGTTLPIHEDVLLGEYTEATVYAVSLSDADAQPITVRVSTDGSTTHIGETGLTTDDDVRIYDVTGRRRQGIEPGLNLIQQNGTTRKFYKK